MKRQFTFKIDDVDVTIDYETIQFDKKDDEYVIFFDKGSVLNKDVLLRCRSYDSDYIIIKDSFIKVFETERILHIDLTRYESEFLLDFINYCMNNVKL